MRVVQTLGAAIGLLLVLCLGSIWLLPQLMPIHARPKESECRTNLRAIYSGQQALREDRNAYSPVASRIGFQPEYGNRYLYLLDRDGHVAERHDAGSPIPLEPEATAVGPDTSRTTETSASLLAKLPLSIAKEVGVRADCDAGPCGFTAACIANLDDDDTPDVWTISTEPTLDFAGVGVPPGVPAHRVSDHAD